MTWAGCSRSEDDAIPVKYRDIIRLIEADGWMVDRIAGGHIQYRHPVKPGTVTVPAGGKRSRDVPQGTLT